MKLEQILSTNGYTADDMTITSCPSAEQVSILLSSASVLADNMQMSARKTSLSSGETGATTRKVSVEKKVSFEGPVPEVQNEMETV